MKRYIHTVLVLFALHLMFPSSSAHGQEVIVDGMKYVIFQGHAVLAECMKEEVGDLVIPETISCDGTEYPVTEIGGQIKEDAGPYHDTTGDPHPFQNCESITSVTLPVSLKKVGMYAFEGCKNLKHVTLTEDVNLGPLAFANCSSLRKVLIPRGCRMSERAFGYCTLDTVEYASGTMTSDNRAFCYSSIGTIIVPSSVEGLPWDWLYGTEQVGNILVFRRTPPIYHVRDCLSDENMQNALAATIYVPYGAVEAYQKDADWGIFERIYEMPDTIPFEEPDTLSTSDSTIVDGMLYVLFRDHAVLAQCLKEDVVDLVIPETVTIGGKTYPVTSVGGQIAYDSLYVQSDGHDFADDPRPFAYCTTITSVTFPATVNDIGQGAFTSCENLKSIRLPETVELGQSCFAFCRSLKHVVIPTGAILSTDKIWSGAPFWFSDLDTLEYETGRDSIVGEAWVSQGTVQTVIVPSTVKSIDNRWMFAVESLGNLIIYAETPPAYNISEFYETKDDNMLSWQWQSLEGAMKANLIVPDDALEAYKNHKDWGLYEHIYTYSDLTTGLAQLQSTPSSSTLNAKPSTLHRYDLTGRRLATPPMKGVYIENGKLHVNRFTH